MSKKLFSTAKWKNYLRSRQIYQLKRSQQLRRRRKELAPMLERKRPGQLPFAALHVPTNFSIIGNAEETIGFVREFAFVARNNNIMLHLDSVSRITIDAITALIAVIEGLGEARIVRGTNPKDDKARGILIQSGFFDHVRSRHILPAVTQGRISREESKKVEPRIAKELIRVGSEAVYGAAQKCYAAYRALIECMSNTHNHAAGRRERLRKPETWYSTVFGDIQTRRVSYVFLDTGVGIFKSVRIGTLRRAYRLLKVENNSDILRDILHGRVESSTGYAYRGKGLPSIYKLCQNGSIKSLIIVSNDVYANATTNEFRKLRTQFPGTLLYWEV